MPLYGESLEHEGDGPGGRRRATLLDFWGDAELPSPTADPPAESSIGRDASGDPTRVRSFDCTRRHFTLI